MMHKGTLMVKYIPFPACLLGILVGFRLLWASSGILCSRLPLEHLLSTQLHDPMVVTEEINLTLLR
jgi:hypothetical protein